MPDGVEATVAAWSQESSATVFEKAYNSSNRIFSGVTKPAPCIKQYALPPCGSRLWDSSRVTVDGLCPKTVDGLCAVASRMLAQDGQRIPGH